MAEDAEEYTCEICLEECERFVTLELGGEENICENCADIVTEEYSL